jgi:tRNA(Ile)-lysidine synthase
MQRRIEKWMRTHGLVQSGDRVLAAVSGGADSVCLLYILAEFRDRAGIELRAAHIHHGLRDTADRDRRFVEELCAELGVPCETRCADVRAYMSEHGTGLEESARILRWQALEDICEAWEQTDGPPVKIAAAHHREDQAETVLFRLCRGSRLAGAAGMQPGSGRIIRPLLDCTRGEIEAALHARGASWCDDETNADTRYARNYLRAEILPLLSGHVNSETVRHLTEFAQEAAETEAYLRIQTEEALRRCCRGSEKESAPSGATERDGSACREIRIGLLREEPPLLQRRILYELLAGAAGRKKDLTALHVQALLQLCRTGGSGRLDLPYGLSALKEYDVLRIVPRTGAETTAEEMQEAESLFPFSADRYRMRVLTARQLCEETGVQDLRNWTPPENKYTKWLDYDKISSLPTLRTRLPGDRIGMETADRSGEPQESGCAYKSIARLMIDAKIPAAVRDRIVLPAVGREILWVPGQRIHAGMKVGKETGQILEIALC